MPISQNAALFALLGTSFGGNGSTNFALPDLQGSVPLHWGQGPGLSPRVLGETGGEQAVTLPPPEVSPPTHDVQASGHPASLNTPGPQNSLARSSPFYAYTQPAGPPPLQSLAPGVLGGAVGGTQPHNNLMPYLTLSFCIALQGIFPARG